jgi:(S)-3,5-dihydroxyphenylglycine transaminase
VKVTINQALSQPLLGVMNFLNEIIEAYPRAISFAPGRPPEHLFDVERALAAIPRYVEHLARETGAGPEEVLRGLGQYDRTAGRIGPLLARYLARDEGIHVAPEAIVVTNGAQEAMSIVLQTIFDPRRDTLLVSDPAYIGVTGAASVLGIPMRPVPTGDAGLDLAALVACAAQVRAAGRNPRALYDIVDFHNPLGTTTPLAARHQLLDLAHEQGLLLIEDNPYGIFAYEGERLPTLKSLDRRGDVLYIGTFSKTLLPGLRIGYAVADQPVVGAAPGVLLADEMSKVKSLVSVTTSPLLQAIVGGTLIEHDFSLVEANRERLRHYRANRDRMLACLESCFGRDEALAGKVTWNRPRGGFFLTLTLPFRFEEDSLRTCAEQYGVICCPMTYFSLAPGRERQVRLSFSYVTQEEIEIGIRSLWRFVRDRTADADAVESAGVAEGIR